MTRDIDDFVSRARTRDGHETTILVRQPTPIDRNVSQLKPMIVIPSSPLHGSKPFDQKDIELFTKIPVGISISPILSLIEFITA